MTTNAIDIRRIETALLEGSDIDFEAAARNLLNAMGYRSERTLALSGDIDDFLHTFVAPNPDTKTERDFREHAESVKLIFQVSDSEITQSVQPDMFDTGEFDKGRAQSFVFVATELKNEEYPRGAYAQFVREINKRFPMPIVALFRAASGRITLAFVNRRVNKRDAERDVLGTVSLIREINPRNPHRAHQDILRELSLDERLKWMDSRDKPQNFDGLLAAWLNALDTEELNKRFYGDLFDWFKRATKQAKFPAAGAKVLPTEEHIIRLITRMLFVWFVKEKRLIAEDLFNEAQVGRLLRNYDRDGGDSYYRAVLQNLFFATLNTEIDLRGFSSRAQRTHRDFSRYRYKSEIADAARLLELFRKTPFINGGLFDCLDSEAATGDGGWRIDFFTDNIIDPRRAEYGLLSIPNRLFFGDDGLINLFDRYKFTVEENTPAEQEVALDPELLGKVFENLLAAYSPETRETARKQTGSYYTPRAVVDYMVDEALVASLSESVQPHDMDKEYLHDRLRYLLDYADAFADADTLFTDSEREAIVLAIAEVKVLDPAVGSGAFPMSMLHKLTLALRRLDEHNELWEALQKKMASERATAAFDTSDPQEREDELKEISDTFEKYRESDFGRKLYLIQNSIYGVDIQPVATQIAKLRFFISLAIEQQPDADAENMGIRPLPNLETRFVAANTLLPLRSQQGVLTSPRVEELQRELDANREGHFHANTRDRKKLYIDRDGELRAELAEELVSIGLEDADAEKIALWDPYDQNESADWFDAEYMFGVSNGFDVVIGNPPYVQIQNKLDAKLKGLYRNSGYQTFVNRGDIYQLFYERGMGLLKPNTGLLAYITSNSWLKAEYGKKTRQFFAEKHTPLTLLELGKDVFESAIVDACVMTVREGRSVKAQSLFDAVDVEQLRSEYFPPDKSLWGRVHLDGDAPWSVLLDDERSAIDKMRAIGPPLKDWDVNINRGVITGYNKAFIIDTETKDALVAADPKAAEIIKPVLRGRDIQRYQARWSEQWLIVAKFGSHKTLSKEFPAIYRHLLQHEDRLKKRGQCRYSRSATSILGANYPGQHHWLELDNNPKEAYLELFAKEKLFWIELVESGRFAYDNSGIYGEATTFIMTGKDIKYLCALLNSSLIGWFLQQIAPTSGMGTLRWKKVYVQNIPIPKVSAEAQRPFIALVDKILAAKAADPQADTSELEEEIDWLVYDLYNLSDEEVTVIADALWDSEVSEEEEDAALVRAIEAGLADDDERFDISVAKEILSEFSEGRI